MMLNRSRTRRPGFTLLEVMLASAIGVFLLAALYFAFDLCLRQADSSRGITQQSDLARAIVNRMTGDLSVAIGPLQPKSGGGVQDSSNINSAAGGTTTAATTTATTTPATGAAAATTTADGSDPSADATPTDQSVSADVPFQGGVFGTDKQLTIYVSRVPTDLVNPLAAQQTLNGGDPKPDLRRITYYLGSTGGLRRQEQFLVTADGVRNSTDPDHSREAQDLIAEEVADVTFEYFDGTTWGSTWAGDDDGGDGKTVKGPPRAVRMTLTLRDPGTGETKTVEHVFAIRAAVGTYTPPMTTDTTTTDTTGGM